MCKKKNYYWWWYLPLICVHITTPTFLQSCTWFFIIHFIILFNENIFLYFLMSHFYGINVTCDHNEMEEVGCWKSITLNRHRQHWVSLKCNEQKISFFLLKNIILSSPKMKSYQLSNKKRELPHALVLLLWKRFLIAF